MRNPFSIWCLGKAKGSSGELSPHAPAALQLLGARGAGAAAALAATDATNPISLSVFCWVL